MAIPNDYIEAVKHLYDEIERWMEDEGIRTRREPVEISEEAFDAYSLDTMIFSHDDEDFARMQPRGARIIGAMGRVDVEGTAGPRRVEIISYLEAGGPAYTVTVRSGSGTIEQQRRHHYTGVAHAGWYWIENRQRGKAEPLTKEAILEILGYVSDYAIVSR